MAFARATASTTSVALQATQSAHRDTTGMWRYSASLVSRYSAYGSPGDPVGNNRHGLLLSRSCGCQPRADARETENMWLLPVPSGNARRSVVEHEGDLHVDAIPVRLVVLDHDLLLLDPHAADVVQRFSCPFDADGYRIVEVLRGFGRDFGYLRNSNHLRAGRDRGLGQLKPPACRSRPVWSCTEHFLVALLEHVGAKLQEQGRRAPA